jgi:hypothetical protein
VPEHVRQASPFRMEATVGDTSEAILHAARRRKAGLNVMATHGLGGVRKLLLGSTTQQVSRTTERPVLAVPAGAVGTPAAEHHGSAEEDSPGDRLSRERDAGDAVGARPRCRHRRPPRPGARRQARRRAAAVAGAGSRLRK